MKRELYPAVVHNEPGCDYGVFFPDFPGCISAGKSIKEAYHMAHEALNLHIAGMLEDGDTIPQPSETEAIDREDAVAVLMISANLPGKNKKLSITLDEHLIEAIDAVAGNRSGFLAEAARHELARRAG